MMQPETASIAVVEVVRVQQAHSASLCGSQQSNSMSLQHWESQFGT